MAVATSSEAHEQSVNLSSSWDQEMTARVEGVALVVGDSSLENKDNVNSTSHTQFSLVLSKCALPPKEELDPVITFVANAFGSSVDQKALQGYRAILDCLRKQADPPMLRNVLLALRMSGSTLHNLTAASKRHAHLLHLIFRLDPFEPPAKKVTESTSPQHVDPYRNFSLADAHLRLLVALVSSNSVFLTPAMNVIWRLIQTEAPPERSARLHAALSTMLRLVPKANSDLFPLYASHFPFRTKPRAELEWYSRQCLFTVKYAPALHGQLLELLVDKCLEMDVEIKIEEGGEVSIHENDDDNLFELEMDAPTNDIKLDTKEDVFLKVDEMADKLDSLMLILFEHMQETVKANDATANLLFKMILPIFESTVLTTHRSKFVQFIILFLCGLEHNASSEATDPAVTNHPSATISRSFCAHLIDIVLDPYRATATRQSSACYLASFLSRASYVSAETVCESICALLNWAEAYMLSIGNRIHAVDARDQCDMHSLFYTACQAAFYSMCFRGIEAIQYYRSSKVHQLKDDGASYVNAELVDINPRRWANICGHALQPLRYCLESVRGEFLDIARVFHLLDEKLLDTLVAEDQKMTSLIRKKKASLITTATTLEMKRKVQGVGGLGRGSNPLDSFFPFDPYLLRRSHRFISPFYKDWEGSLCDKLEDVHIVADEGGYNDDEIHDGTKSEGVAEESQRADLPESVDSTAYLQSMSLSPSKSQIISGLGVANRGPKTPATVGGGSTDSQLKKQEQQEAWARTLKRSRAPSIENGSW